MSNKWARSQSPSGIPRLLQKKAIYGSAESISRSPSPVKTTPGSKLPTPRIQKANSTPDLTKDLSISQEFEHNNTLNTTHQAGATDILEFADPLEEMFLPTTPPSESESKLFQDDVSCDEENKEENNWLLSDGSRIPPLLETSIFEESDEIDDIPSDLVIDDDDIQNNNVIAEVNDISDDSEFSYSFFKHTCYLIYKNIKKVQPFINP